MDLATRSNSSFFLIAYELLDPLAALISSSAKHSAIVLMLRNAASLAPVHKSQIAWFTRLNGETSTACLLTVPARPILVESSRGPALMMAVTKIFKNKENISKILINVKLKMYVKMLMLKCSILVTGIDYIIRFFFI